MENTIKFKVTKILQEHEGAYMITLNSKGFAGTVEESMLCLVVTTEQKEKLGFSYGSELEVELKPKKQCESH